MKSKKPNRKQKKWLEAVGNIDACVLCGSTHMLQVAHRNGNRGWGQKAPDYETAKLCGKCHHDIDNGKDLSKLERKELMHRAIVETHSILIEEGVLGI